jgi:hypothetical protein
VLTPFAVVLDNENVYWTNEGRDAADAGESFRTYTYKAGTGSIVKAPLAGGEAVTLASGLNQPCYLALDESSLYWTNCACPEDCGLNEFPGTVMKMGIAGGAPETIATDQKYPTAIAVDDTSVYWVNGGGRETSMGLTVLKRTPK